MKLVIRNWQGLTGLLVAGLICATYLLAQTQTTQTSGTADITLAASDTQEAVDSARLIQAVNAGDSQTALQILQTYGIADNTLMNMAAYLGKPAKHADLQESFLRATTSVPFSGQTANVLESFANIGGQSYIRPYWYARSLKHNWMIKYDVQLANCPAPPIAVLNAKLNDPFLIEYFKWYDRYAEQLHSVVLNGPNLVNSKIKTGYGQVGLQLNALFQLIKARKPDAFVWLAVAREDDRTDEAWLRAMTFRPDGLQIGNLTQFHSQFAGTRQRYVSIVGTDTPLMVMGFLGYKDLSRQSLAEVATNQMTAAVSLQRIGGVVGNNLTREEQHLSALGYRGLGVHWILLQAVQEAQPNGGQNP